MIISNPFFNQSVFFVDIQITNGKKMFFRDKDVISFTVIQEETQLGQWMGEWGPLKPKFKWYDA